MRDATGPYLRGMPAKKSKAVPAVKPAIRRARVPRVKRVTRRSGKGAAARKVFDDPSLFGALPGMSEWALPLLKELRDE